MAQINADADLAQPQNTARRQQFEQRITSGDDHKEDDEQHDSGGEILEHRGPPTNRKNVLLQS